MNKLDLQNLSQNLNDMSDSQNLNAMRASQNLAQNLNPQILQISQNLSKNLACLKKPPKHLFYKGNLDLLDSFKVAIVGTRAPNPYTKMLTSQLASKIAKYAVVVSGGALGVDIIAHQGAFPRTIMISPSSLDILYPRENAKFIQKIAESALILSEYEQNYMPHRHSFLERNRLVVALSDIVILPQGDLKSGTNSSANYALNFGKPIFTLPHRYNESTLTNALLAKGQAKAIYNIDDFLRENIPQNLQNCEDFAQDCANAKGAESDEILEFCAKCPSFEEAFAKFGDKILEYEFEGLLVREGNAVRAK